MKNNEDKHAEKFRIIVPVGSKEVYYREPISSNDEGKTLDTRLFHFAPGTGFYRLTTQRDLDIKKQKIQAADDQDIFIDVRISFKLAGGNKVSGPDADYFLQQEALNAKALGDQDKAQKIKKLIKSKNSYARREYWEKHHPILTFVANEDAIRAEYNAIKEGKEHKAGPIESVINETLRKYLTHLPYYVIQNVNNPTEIEVECLNNGITDQSTIDRYKKLGEQIKLELTRKFYKFGLQIVAFSYGDIVATQEFEAQQERKKQLVLEKGIAKQESEINLIKAKNAQQVAKMQADQDAYKEKVIGSAQAEVLAEKANAVQNLSAGQIAAMNGTGNVNNNEYNINGLEKVVGAAAPLFDIGRSVARSVNANTNANAPVAPENVTDYREVSDEDMFTEKEEGQPISNEEMFTEKEEVVVTPVEENVVNNEIDENSYTATGTVTFTETGSEPDNEEEEQVVEEEEKQKVKKI